MVDTRRPRKRVSYTRYERVLKSGDVAVKGERAFFDTSAGYVVAAAATSTTLIPIGFFDESKTGDGTKKIGVTLDRELLADWLDNDETNPVLTTDIGSECYVVDGRTVSISSASSTRSKAGRVWDVDSVDGVLVEAGAAVTGPTGATGSGPGTTASRTTLKAVAAAGRYDGQVVTVLSDGSEWIFVAASAVDTDVAEELVLIPGAGTGRWIRNDRAFVLKAPIAFGMADGALILTVPDGYMLKPIGQPFWEVTTGWTGGSSSAIGIASDHTGYATAGDILGGAAGDVAATLVAGVIPGTIGVKFDTLAELQAFFLDAGESFTYEEITSAFTAGAGFFCVPVAFMKKA